MIGIIDYGSGNLRSVYNAFRYLDQEVFVCKTPEELKKADRIVLPGVGSSKDAMTQLKQSGLSEALLQELNKGKSFLGICLGLQLLFSKSYESGGCDCLGIVKGEVKLFPGGPGLKVPQIGWNTVKVNERNCPLFEGVEDNSFFYFVHSYYCDNYESEYTLGTTEYGIQYVSALWKDNIYAVQFHPERSQENGLKILKNFIKL